MLFNSQTFILLFLPLTLGLYYAVAGNRVLRQLVAVVGSLVFYAFWDPRFVPVLVILALLNWQVGRLHEARPDRHWPEWGVALNLAVLGWFKFTNFLAGSVAAVIGTDWQPLDIILPLGISFFVFQKISYLVDLRRGKAHAYPLLDFLMFVTFFPQLVAGPIIRHNEIIHQFRADPRGPQLAENLARGAVLFLCGLAKKAILADPAGEVADRMFAVAGAGDPNLGQGWLAAAAFTLQIYFDFSGYSDMAIGLGLMFGLRLPCNFDAPYRATSLSEFWRRWHMSLSRFLRDYLYIPLGGNRGGLSGRLRNLMVTMLLGGLWHGANWTFVAWGGLHGAGLAAGVLWQRTGRRMPPLLGWALTLLFVMACWVLFRAPDFATAARVLAGMAGLNGLGGVYVDNAGYLVLGAAVALLGPTSQVLVLERLRPWVWLAAPLGLVAVLLLLFIGARPPNEFIYFQF